MNLRHAAALALVGFYLIVPYSQGPHYGNWNVVGKFASVESCEAAASNLQTDGFEWSAVWIDPKPSLGTWQKQAAMCVELHGSVPKEVPDPWSTGIIRPK
jgi:hypothetical protein